MSDNHAGRCMLRTRGLRREYGREASLVRAVDRVDLDVARSETVAVMGRNSLIPLPGAAPHTDHLRGRSERPRMV